MRSTGLNLKLLITVNRFYVPGVISMMLLTLLVPLSVIAQHNPPDSCILAYVGDEPIRVREFIGRSSLVKASVALLLSDTTRRGTQNEMLSIDSKELSADRLLKLRTLDTIIYIKVQQLLARKYGLKVVINYPDFLKAMEQENAKRQQAHEMGEVIYGPLNYSESSYFSYTYSNTIINLKRKLEEEVFKVNDSCLKALYNQDKQLLCNNGYYIEAEVYWIAVKSGEEEASRKAFLDSLENLKTKLAGGKVITLEDRNVNLQGFDMNNAQYEKFIYNDSVYASEQENPFKSEVMKTAHSLLQGGVGEIQESGKRLFFVYVPVKFPLPCKSFDHCMKTLRRVNVDRLYRQFIEEEVNRTKIRMDREIYNDIKL
jgi:hypothetical protein